MTNIIATIATIFGVFASLSFLFQTMKIMHLHESKDVALPTYLVLFLTALSWLVYGLTIGDLPLIISYIVGSLCTLSVIVVYFIYRKKLRVSPVNNKKKPSKKRRK